MRADNLSSQIALLVVKKASCYCFWEALKSPLLAVQRGMSIFSERCAYFARDSQPGALLWPSQGVTANNKSERRPAKLGDSIIK